MNDLRREIKIILNTVKTMETINLLGQYSTLMRKWPKRYVHSIYFDDKNFSSAADNLSGIARRQKYRLRWYSNDGVSATMPEVSNFEIKRKHGLLSSKSVFPIEVSGDPADISYKRIGGLMRAQLPDYIFPNSLMPTVHIQYLREYFEVVDGLRVTIDSEINFFDAFSTLNPSFSASKSFDDNILEVKYSPRQHDTARALLQILKMSPYRNSKYLLALSAFGRVKYF